MKTAFDEHINKLQTAEERISELEEKWTESSKIEIQREKIFKILKSHKNDETLPFVIAQMDLEGILLSELSQKRKDMSCGLSVICEMLKKKIETK